LIQPSYLYPLTHDFFGIMGLIVAGILSVVGWIWLQKIVDIEV
jgi:Flp pilus assembly protein TadB